MKLIFIMLVVIGIQGCAISAPTDASKSIKAAMDDAVESSVKPSKQEDVNNALLPPLQAPVTQVDSAPVEPKFDLAVNNTPAQQVFMAIVSGTRFSMLLPPEVSGNITLNLKNVTMLEALEAIREMYGYEYKIDGSRIYIQAMGLQTRIFQVNYLTGSREGASTVTVKSPDATPNASATGTATGGATSSNSTQNKSSSVVTKTSSVEFWNELNETLKAIVGDEKGRSVKLNPMSGIIVVRAFPDEMRNVAAYLKASQLAIERQVMIEAKIVEVQLNDSYQSGVNWATFSNQAKSVASAGVVGAGTTLASAQGGATLMGNATLSAVPGSDLVNTAAGSLFGLAFQTSNFGALLSFLETQGDVHVLSSPRIATLNNQKAVLKVGTDEYFATGFTSTAGTSTGVVVTQTTVTPVYQMFFSGIALDVTPKIDENNEIILHVHPSVSKVGAVDKQALIGVSGSSGVIGLASSTISETDSVVRVRGGQIVAIGGLMSQASSDNRSGLPGMPKTLFGQVSQTTQKRELVILLKPTIVDSDKDWSDDIARSRERVNALSR